MRKNRGGKEHQGGPPPQQPYHYPPSAPQPYHPGFYPPQAAYPQYQPPVGYGGAMMGPAPVFGYPYPQGHISPPIHHGQPHDVSPRHPHIERSPPVVSRKEDPPSYDHVMSGGRRGVEINNIPSSIKESFHKENVRVESIIQNSEEKRPSTPPRDGPSPYGRSTDFHNKKQVHSKPKDRSEVLHSPTPAFRGARGGRGGGRGTRGTRGRGRGGRDASFHSRKKPPTHKSDVDKGSEVTASSVGMEQHELLVEVQRQLIGELKIDSADTDGKGVLVEVRNGSSDYSPLALKNFLEHCTGNRRQVVSMVLSSDKQAAVAIFDQDIDCDEFDHFVTEPHNHFLDLELDFDQIDECSALIVFTEEEDEYEDLVQKLDTVSPGVSENIFDHNQADEFILLSFSGVTESELQQLMKEVRQQYPDVDIHPVYPYPSPQYMHVSTDSYIDFPTPASVHDDEGFRVLLAQVDSIRSDKELRKIMTIEKFSGGDSSAKVFPADLESRRAVTYAKPEVCVKVMSYSPIMHDERVVGHASLSANVPVDKANGVISSCFLMLTGVGSADLTKDLIMYYCANHAKHTVLQVYFTTDEDTAVVMFSPEASGRRPDFASLYRHLLASSELQGVRAWQVLAVRAVQVFGVTDGSTNSLTSRLSTWNQTSEVQATCQSLNKQMATLNCRSEQDAVRLLSRSEDSAAKLQFGDNCLELPVIEALSGSRLFTEKLSAVIPQPLPFSRVVEQLGYTDDHTQYLKTAATAGGKLRKVLNRCQAFCKLEQSLFLPNIKNLNETNLDLARVFTRWPTVLKDGIEDLLSDVSVMEECAVPRAQWTGLRSKKPSSLLVIEMEQSRTNVMLRAVGNSDDIRKFQLLINGSDPGTGHSSKDISMQLSEGTFIRYKHIPILKADFPDAIVNVSFGSELATVNIKGSDDDAKDIEDRITTYRASLKHRQITVNIATWGLLNSRKSRAFMYLNNGALSDLGVQYTCLNKSETSKFILLTTEADNKASLEQAERTIRDGVVIKSFELGTRVDKTEEWKQFDRPLIEETMANKRLPLHIIEPKDLVGKVQIVSVKEADVVLDDLLESTAGPSSSSAEFSKDSGAKPKKNVPKKDSRTPKKPGKVKPLMESSVPPMEFTRKSDNKFLADGGPSRQSGDQDGKKYMEEVKLAATHQYIEYQFVTKYMPQLMNSDMCEITKNPKTKAITIASSFMEAAKKAKRDLLAVVKSLHKRTEEVKRDADRKAFERAASGLQLQFLLNESHQLMDFAVGTISVIACKHTIQCIRADAVIIAVNDSLDMNDSGVGSILAVADPTASRELKSRYDSSTPDLPGYCQEVPSKSRSTLYNTYVVMVVDIKDKSSLYKGFAAALERCHRLRVSSVVTNLLGSDMRGFVSDKESAAMMLDCVSQHTKRYEKSRLTTLYLCETNENKVSTLREEINKHGRGVEYVESSLPLVGSKMLSICSSTRSDADKFMDRCAEYLA